MKSHHSSFVEFFKKYKVFILILASVFILALIVLTVASYYIIEPNNKYILSPKNATKTDVGLVLGAGITKSGAPYNELKARLDKSADALYSGKVSKLILSGDNRFHSYDEPTAMFNYLTNKKHIPANKLQRDYAGRSTYESCERAAKIFKVKKTIIFSAHSHLPRAIYLCRHFGIETYGISSGVEANNSTRRELLARVKAVYNANFIGEHTVLGNPLPID